MQLCSLIVLHWFNLANSYDYVSKIHVVDDNASTSTRMDTEKFSTVSDYDFSAYLDVIWINIVSLGRLIKSECNL